VRAGFRLDLAGSDHYFGFEADLICFCKALANGYNVSALCGKEFLKNTVSGMSYTGSYWLSAVPFAAGIACIEKMKKLDLPNLLLKKGELLADGLLECAKKHGFDLRITGAPALFYLRIADDPTLMTHQAWIAECVKRGIPVIHGDLNSNLDYLQDKSFDCVLLTRVLQELANPETVLREVTRIGKRGLVGFINFGHISNRMQLAFAGRMPRNVALPHEWYNTPNIHLGTLYDFRDLCKTLGIKIVSETPIAARFPRLTAVCPNWFAVGCVFVLEKSNSK
jgi:methionine biosynthesis protein MetW